MVTGGTGFIGSFLGLKLLENGYKVFFLARKKEKDPEVRIKEKLEKISSHSAKYEKNWEVLDGDITLSLFGISEEKLKKLKNEKIVKVFHCAALLSFKPANETHTFKVNVEGTKHAIEVAEILGAELHHLSTAYVAGDRTGEIKEDEFDKGQNFRNVYERTKFEGEKMVREWIKENGRAVVYRPSIVVGDFKDGITFSFTGYYMVARFFFEMAKYFQKRRNFSNFPLPIPVVKESTLNLIPVDIIVDAILKISENPKNLGSTFHIVHPHPPYNSFVFNTSVHFLGFPNVKIIQVSLLTLHLLVKTGWLFSWFFGKNGKLFRNLVLTYIPYFNGSMVFRAHNVFSGTGGKYSPPKLNEEFIRKILGYAMKADFKDI